MKIKNLNSDKLLTLKDKEVKILKDTLINGTKYIIFSEEGIFNYNKNRKLIDFKLRFKNGCVFFNGTIIYIDEGGLYYSMNIISGEGSEWDKLHIPNNFKNKCKKIIVEYKNII